MPPYEEQYICAKCGKAKARKRNFYTCRGAMYRGAGHLPWCKTCVDAMYAVYLQQRGNARDAVRQMCRKLDLYWNEDEYDAVEKQNAPKSMFQFYLSRLSTVDQSGLSYDETLSKEKTLWVWKPQKPTPPKPVEALPEKSKPAPVQEAEIQPAPVQTYDDAALGDIPDDVIAFWGAGYSPGMYRELEQRRSYWMSRYAPDEDLDIGTEALIRQICSLELDINRDRAAGRSVEKSVIALNTLLGSANLKPVQKKQDDADAVLTNTPMGVWLYRYENERPLPEIDDELKENKNRRYVFTWMGHLCKMLGLKNAYAKLYDDEIERLRVEKPEYSGDEDDDEAFMTRVMEDADEDEELPFEELPEDEDA